MTRNGKIARLPNQIREQINERLRDGVAAKDILPWLNDLPEVKAILAAKFQDQQITEDNISQWRNGGYCDWENQNLQKAAVSRLSEEAAAIQSAGRKDIAEQLTICVLAKLALALQAHAPAQPLEAGQLKILASLSALLATIRRGNHTARFVEIEAGRLKLAQQCHRTDRDGLHEKLTSGKRKGGISEETLREIEQGARLL